MIDFLETAESRSQRENRSLQFEIVEAESLVDLKVEVEEGLFEQFDSRMNAVRFIQSTIKTENDGDS